MTTKVFDTFIGAAGGDLAAHTPDIDVVGGGWADSGTNTVELDGSGAAKFAAVNNNSRIDSGTTNQWATANWNSGGADNRTGVYLRTDDVNLSNGTSYHFNFRPGDTGGAVYIYTVIAGSSTVIASDTTLTLDTSTVYSLEPEIDGSNLDFIIDGTSELSITNTDITTGAFAGIKHALYTDGAGRFYDFQINDAAPSTGFQAAWAKNTNTLIGAL